MDHTEIVLSGQTALQLTFDPGAFGQTPVTARCRLDHPFYVKNKGGRGRHDHLCRPLDAFKLSLFRPDRLVVVLPRPDGGASWDSLL